MSSSSSYHIKYRRPGFYFVVLRRPDGTRYSKKFTKIEDMVNFLVNTEHNPVINIRGLTKQEHRVFMEKMLSLLSNLVSKNTTYETGRIQVLSSPGTLASVLD